MKGWEEGEEEEAGGELVDVRDRLREGGERKFSHSHLRITGKKGAVEGGCVWGERTCITSQRSAEDIEGKEGRQSKTSRDEIKCEEEGRKSSQVKTPLTQSRSSPHLQTHQGHR